MELCSSQGFLQSSSDYSSDSSEDGDTKIVLTRAKKASGGGGVVATNTGDCPFEADDERAMYLRFARSAGQSSYSFLARENWNPVYKVLDTTELPLRVFSLKGEDNRDNFAYLLGIYSNGDAGTHSSCAGAVYVPAVSEDETACIKSVAAAGEILARRAGYGGKIPNGWNSLGFIWDNSRPQYLLPIGRLRPGVNPDGKNNRKRAVFQPPVSQTVQPVQPLSKRSRTVVPVKKVRIDGIQRISKNESGGIMLDISQINPDTGYMEHMSISPNRAQNPATAVCMFLEAFFGGDAPLFICPPYDRDKLVTTLNYWATQYDLSEEVEAVGSPFDMVIEIRGVSYVPPQMPGLQPRAFMGVTIVESGPLFSNREYKYTETSFPFETGSSATPPHRRIVELVSRLVCQSFPEIISASDPFTDHHPFWPPNADRASGELRVSGNCGKGKGVLSM
jgi:hypothetical protein